MGLVDGAGQFDHVQGGVLGQGGVEDGQAEGAADVSAEVHQARGVLDHVRRQGGHRHLLRGDHGQHDAGPAHGLDPSELPEAPLIRHDAGVPHAPGGHHEAHEHQDARIHRPHQPPGDGACGEHGQAGDDHGGADLGRRIVAHSPQKQRQQEGAAEQGRADDEGHQHPDHEVAVAEGAQLDDRIAVAERAPDEGRTADGGDDAEQQDHVVGEPVLLGALLQHELQAHQEGGHQGQAQPVEALGQAGVALVEMGVAPDQEQDDHAGKDVYEEQPAPAEPFGQMPAQGRADGGGQRYDQPHDDAGRHAPLGREGGEGHGEDGRDHGPADEALKRAEDDHHLDRRRQAHGHAHHQEAETGGQEDLLRAPQPRQVSRQRDHHDLGDQIGGLDPADLIG